MDVQEFTPAGPSALADAADCKTCHLWRDAVGRCSVPEAERRCGWTAATEDLAPQPAFTLFGGGY
jgi:hypothetical protein